MNEKEETIMDPRKYVNPSFPLGDGLDENDNGFFFSDETVCPPLDENETSESLLKKYFTSPNESQRESK